MKIGIYKLERVNIRMLVAVLLFTLFQSFSANAQLPENEFKQASNYKNFKILEEYKQRGNTVRVVEYTEGHIKITETIILPGERVQKGLDKPLPFAVNTPSSGNDAKNNGGNNIGASNTSNNDSVILVINKSKYNLNVYYKKNIIRSYKAVFGPQPMMNKCVEGDRCTPEGWFRITDKHLSSKYNKFLEINYPNDSAVAQFNRMKDCGRLPKSAKIGGNVGIHGIWTGGDNMIELGVGWTDGCIALKNKDVEELFSFVKVGTRVFITK